MEAIRAIRLGASSRPGLAGSHPTARPARGDRVARAVPRWSRQAARRALVSIPAGTALTARPAGDSAGPGECLALNEKVLSMRCRRFYWLLVLALSWAGPVSASPVTVDTAWLASHLDDPGLVLVDMTADPVQYRRFHLPGARYLTPRTLIEKNKAGISLRVPDQRLFRVLGELGINADSHVVIYDDMGGLEAGRLFWELERTDHARVSVLDGGLVKWVLEGVFGPNRRKYAVGDAHARAR